MPKLTNKAIDAELRNLKLHTPHIEMIARGLPRERNALLRAATPELVKALATAIRILAEKGVRFAPSQQRRARRMMSRNTSHKTKKELVSGKKGVASRGGGFYADVGNTLMRTAPEALSGGGISWDDVGHWFTKAGQTIKDGTVKLADGLEHDIMHIGDKATDSATKVATTALGKDGAVTAAVGPGGAATALAQNPAIAGGGFFDKLRNAFQPKIQPNQVHSLADIGLYMKQHS
jgi:hypothetical protein